MSLLRNSVIGLAVAAIVWPVSEPPEVSDGLSGSEWRVVEIDGRAAAGAGRLRFTQTSVRGKSGCADFMGAFHEAGTGIEIAGLNITQLICEGRGDIAGTLLEALGRARGYRLEGAVLQLIDGGGSTVMRLVD